MTQPVKDHSDDAKPLRFEPDEPKTVPLRRPQDRSPCGYPDRLPA